MRCSAHHIEYELQVVLRNISVKEVGHAVHEDEARLLPVQGNV
jgi:hypothetical protein